jgi:hypothetical protein
MRATLGCPAQQFICGGALGAVGGAEGGAAGRPPWAPAICCSVLATASGAVVEAPGAGTAAGAAGVSLLPDQLPLAIIAAIGSAGWTGYRSKIRRCL